MINKHWGNFYPLSYNLVIYKTQYIKTKSQLVILHSLHSNSDLMKLYKSSDSETDNMENRFKTSIKFSLICSETKAFLI